MISEMLVEMRLPEQKKCDGDHVFPAVVCPNPNPSCLQLQMQKQSQSQSQPQMDLCETLRKNKAWIEELLHRSGAVLLRGFPLRSASDFNAVVEAFGYEELPYVGGAGSRTKVLGRVYTANESPPDQKIPFHHEMAHANVFPSKLFFFCEEEPKKGGQTPIVLSHLVYQRIQQRFPDFVERLEEHGVVYTVVLAAEFDPSSPVGRGWQLTFSTDDKTIAEQRAAQLGIKLEWMDNGVKAVAGPMAAFRFDKARGRKVWFNSALTAGAFTANDPQNTVLFGDGTGLPTDVVNDCLKILDEERVTIPWQKGDILLLDNLAVLHSRESFEPPRRILVSLCK